jgi:hypothetical protein
VLTILVAYYVATLTVPTVLAALYILDITPTISAATTALVPAVSAVLVARPVATLTVRTLLPNSNAIAAAAVPAVLAALAFPVTLANVAALAATLSSTAATVPTMLLL